MTVLTCLLDCLQMSLVCQIKHQLIHRDFCQMYLEIGFRDQNLFQLNFEIKKKSNPELSSVILNLTFEVFAPEQLAYYDYDNSG